MLEVLLFLCQYELLSWIFSDLNIHIIIKKFYIEIMPKYHSASKILFYHLPTRGRAGIKFGDAWYVSNVSIIFDCSMLYYLLFWAILGFIIHFYIIFGTNLLTGGPAQIFFLCLFQCFEEKEYQTESKRNEINWRSYFWKETHLMNLDPTSGETRGAHEGGGRPPLGRAPLSHGTPWLLWRPPCTHIYPRDLKLPERIIDRKFCRQKPP